MRDITMQHMLGKWLEDAAAYYLTTVRIATAGRKLAELQMLYQDYIVGMVTKVWKEENLLSIP